MPGSLVEIVENKKSELSERMRSRDLESFRHSVSKDDHRFAAALSRPGVNLICELKPKSPSAGVLRGEVNVDEIIAAYNRHASAISVLTDAKYFGGSLELLETVNAKSSLPTLCKDFVITPYQCFEAREVGAAAVLLIVKILTDAQLRSLYECITLLGMDAVVEVQTVAEVERALRVKPGIMMINNRDLSTFEMDLGTTERLAELVPADTILISASGVLARSDIERLLPYCSNFLIGSALMKSENMDALLAEFTSLQAPAKAVR
ncbi:MAG TPA: indole-3-glycerol phosphate synthase TrpC [Drouetiella sp.]|jgi:indole-3-glycerol phosphate synthase / phosphoribosylanthranilate isomerase